MATLKEKAQAALAAISAGGGRHVIEVDQAGQRLHCDLADVDSLACALNQLTLSTDALANISGDELKNMAETLAGRLSYLLEAISPVEFDAEQCVVQMRSSPPQKDEDSTSYYELLARRGGHVSLIRYTKPSGQVRSQAPAHLTREVLLRLVDDFSSVAP